MSNNHRNNPLGITYYFDNRWKRTEAAYRFYNDYDSQNECRPAMFMIDCEKNDQFEFDYEFPKLSKTVTVVYSAEKRRSALKNPDSQLTDEEEAIRFIFDVDIGYLERVFYCISNRYFTKKELFFYRYWLEKLVSDEFEDVRNYALRNSCGFFIQYLRKYKKDYRKADLSLFRG